MMFTLYTKKSLLPSDLEFVRNINAYYNLYAKDFDKDDEYVIKVLKEIEGAYITSPITFVGKFVEASIYKEYLSTGAKACLLLHGYPEKCFNLAECGQNVFEFLIANAKDGIGVYTGVLPTSRFENSLKVNGFVCNNKNELMEAIK